MKWALPPSSARSKREPAPTQMPSETERTPSIRSNTILAPFGSVIFSYMLSSSPPLSACPFR